MVSNIPVTKDMRGTKLNFQYFIGFENLGFLVFWLPFAGCDAVDIAMLRRCFLFVLAYVMTYLFFFVPHTFQDSVVCKVHQFETMESHSLNFKLMVESASHPILPFLLKGKCFKS